MDGHQKYIFVTGGVASSLGKGVSIASMGALLEGLGFRVTIQKLDPYLNVDPGTMSPFQHGEVFVTDDGAETDLDLGYYERYTSASLTRLNSVSTGQIYFSVIQRERRGEYLGRTVQVIPHITNEIKNRIIALAKADPAPDFVLVEIGGTVGDIESVPFLEAIRQMRLDIGPENTMFIHLTLVPQITEGGELKTKPTQHSVKELLKQGIQPDLLLCRSPAVLPEDVKQKISLFCNVPQKRVISAPDIRHIIYEVPEIYHNEGLDHQILSFFRLDPAGTGAEHHLNRWREVSRIYAEPAHVVRIALVGKYMSLSDAYRSLYEALQHGGFANDARVEFIKIDSEDVTSENVAELTKGAAGILVPGGFGDRGINGKLAAIRYARENRIPYFGICLGMQLAVVEFARNIAGWKDANSTELEENCGHPVISLMDEQIGISDKGGTMRLGAYRCSTHPGTLLRAAYDAEIISERHRHRFEFTNKYRNDLEQAGLVVSGISPDNSLVEAIELSTTEHPWFVATQFHPEFKSRPLTPHPLFREFIRAAVSFSARAK